VLDHSGRETQLLHAAAAVATLVNLACGGGRPSFATVVGPGAASVVKVHLSAGTPIPGATVAVVLGSEQDGWEGVSSTIAAAWTCTFGKNGIRLSTPFAGAAGTICCVRNP
jgi:hypothetical protein